MLCYRLSVVIVLFCSLCCSVIMVLFYVLIVCTVTLPPGVNPIAVDKYISISIYGPIKDPTGWRVRTNDELQVLYIKPNTVTTIQVTD